MTRGLRFSESFWDADIQATGGWDTLVRRMKEGKRVLGEVVHYLKDRVKAESEYSKALSNLAKKADGKEETGVLGDSWRAMKANTEKIASVHEEAAAMFQSLMEELNRFHEEQSKAKKQIEETVKKHIQTKKTDYSKAMTLKKTYEDKCKDYNSAEESYKAAKGSVTVKKNELEKAESKMSKCKENRDSADTGYKSGLEQLESTRKTWESETERACKQFEDLETNRIEYLRDILWKITNVDSLACLKHDDCSESIRTILEQCDVTADLENFIKNNSTGSKRPDPVLYENYYNSKSLPTKSSGLTRTPSTRPPLPSPSRPPPRPSFDDEEGTYASVDSVATSGNSHNPVMLQVIRDHHRTNTASVSELTVMAGDLVEYIGESNMAGMVKVKYGRNVGCLPKNCLITYQPSTKPSTNILLDI